MTTTVIRNAPWLVGWDAANQRHVYLNDGDVAFTDGLIDHVGGRYTGPSEVEIDGRDRLVMPGLVNIHSHHPCTSERCINRYSTILKLGSRYCKSTCWPHRHVSQACSRLF